MKILVIGAGNMGLTFAQGMCGSEMLTGSNIMIMDTSVERITELQADPHFDAYLNLKDCVPAADLIFIAVKPYHAKELFTNMAPFMKDEQIIISVMAGVTISSLKNWSGLEKVVRAMPNLPAKVGMGLTSYVASPEVSKVELLTIGSLLDTTGTSVLVESEKFIDASTGISGSGPAYVFYFMQSMMEAALKMGFSDEVSKVLVSQTFTGAVQLFNDSDLSPNAWMDMVASKGGTTQAALDSMEANNVKELIKDAAFAAFDRAIELGKEK